MTALAPTRTLVPLYQPDIEQGRTTDDRPFGLTLATPSAGQMPVLDLTGVRLDPVTQTAVGAAGDIWAGKQTTQTVTTNVKTTHDHQSWQDSNTDTYQD
ncbi:putative ATP-grasp-modified RiPP [Micromonospora sp. WMMD737]|uniref:putative ATP-grasp-modified RiPP n=1 Tax=Micromonospora sp. WMMD737 TaxID=3404113 RepID=UPI003B95999C